MGRRKLGMIKLSVSLIPALNAYPILDPNEDILQIEQDDQRVKSGDISQICIEQEQIESQYCPEFWIAQNVLHRNEFSTCSK